MNKLLITLLTLNGLMLNPTIYAEQNITEETECAIEATSTSKRSYKGSELLDEIKKLAEIGTAIGTGIVAYTGAMGYFNSMMYPVEKNDFNSGVYAGFLLGTSTLVFYLLQKFPKEFMKEILGRKYDVLTFNTIMGLTITNLFTIGLLYSTGK